MACIHYSTKIPEGRIYKNTRLDVICDNDDGFDNGLDFLVHYPRLKRLEISSISATLTLDDLAGIENCPHLEILVINHTNIRSFRFIEFCSELRHIEIAQSLIGSFEMLELLPSLQFLDLASIRNSKKLFRPEALTGLRGLEVLSLNDCKIKDLRCINELKLSHLVCKQCSLKSLRGLRIDNLVLLDISGNKIRNIGKLERAKKLQHLRLCNNRIEDFGPIDWAFDRAINIALHYAYSGPIKALSWMCETEYCESDCDHDYHLSEIFQDYRDYDDDSSVLESESDDNNITLESESDIDSASEIDELSDDENQNDTGADTQFMNRFLGVE